MAEYLKRAARWVVAADACFWLLSGVSSTEIHLFFLVPGCLLLAFGLSAVSKFFAKLLLRDVTSVIRTERKHIAVAAISLVVAALAGLLLLIVILAPVTWVWWILTLGRLPLVLANTAMPTMAGVMLSLSEYLSKATRHAQIGQEIEHLILLKRRIDEPKKNVHRAMPKMALLVFLASASVLGPAHGADTCFIAVDESASVDAASMRLALDFMENTALSYAESSQCSRLSVIRFSEHMRFARRRWLDVPKPLSSLDCQIAQPEPLVGFQRFYRHLTNFEQFRHERAVTSCREHEVELEISYRATQAQFRTELAEALAVTQRADVRTDIRETLGLLTKDAHARAVLLITDGVDNPPRPLYGLSIPLEMSAIMVIVQPDEHYYSKTAVLARASQWAAVPGLKVVTAQELHPTFWEDIKKEKE